MRVDQRILFCPLMTPFFLSTPTISQILTGISGVASTSIIIKVVEVGHYWHCVLACLVCQALTLQWAVMHVNGLLVGLLKASDSSIDFKNSHRSNSTFPTASLYDGPPPLPLLLTLSPAPSLFRAARSMFG